MPKHALDRATIAELILAQLSPDAGAKLFLLNFERLILQDFSRYETHREFGRKPPDARISGEYLSIIEELMQAELPVDQSQQLKELLSALNEASPDDAGKFARDRSADVRSLFRFFPQPCFALIGGAFFEAFLKGNDRVHGFKRNKGVHFGRVDKLRSLYSPRSPSYSELPYTKDCGNFVEWLTAPFRQEKEWLYVAPVICDGSFFGLLYLFGDDENKTVTRELRDALAKAETLFRDMRYALIADVAERTSQLEDLLDAFLAELPNYQNVALAATWSEEGDPVVYGRTFVKGVQSSYTHTPERRLAWEEIPAAHIYSQGEINDRAWELYQLSRRCSENWVEVTQDDEQVEAISLNGRDVRRLFREEVLRAYDEAGLSLCYGVVIPGKFIRPDYYGRHLELYFFEPAEANIKRGEKRFTQGIRRKLHSLIPLLQEIAVWKSSSAEQARRRNQIIASLVFHEIKNSLQRRTNVADFVDGKGVPDWLSEHGNRCSDDPTGIRVEVQWTPDWLSEHVNRCLDAYGSLDMKPCTRGGWSEVRQWLGSYWSHYVNKRQLKVTGWPRGVGSIKLSKELIYVIACELIKNAITARSRSIEIMLTCDSALCATTLSVINNATIDDFSRLKSNLDEYWKSGLTFRSSNGLALIMQLLRVLQPGKAPPIDADMFNGKVRTWLYLILA